MENTVQIKSSDWILHKRDTTKMQLFTLRSTYLFIYLMLLLWPFVTTLGASKLQPKETRQRQIAAAPRLPPPKRMQDLMIFHVWMKW